jgi:hypothetical protein
MNPATRYQLVQAQIADQRHHAERERIAKAVNRTRCGCKPPSTCSVPSNTVTDLGGRVVTQPGTRSTSLTR